MRSSANTSNTGRPAELLTDIKESLKSSTTLKIVPLVPSALIKVSLETEDTTCKIPEGVRVLIPSFPLI